MYIYIYIHKIIRLIFKKALSLGESQTSKHRPRGPTWKRERKTSSAWVIMAKRKAKPHLLAPWPCAGGGWIPIKQWINGWFKWLNG